jgi:ATP-dependent Lon protease
MEAEKQEKLDSSVNEEEFKIPDELPLLPVRDVVIFPYMIMPLFVGREFSIKAIDEALSKDRMIFIAAQKDMNEEVPGIDDIYEIGTIAMIMRMLKLPDGRVKILVQGISKGKIKEFKEIKPFFSVQVEKIEDKKVTELTNEEEALMRDVKEKLEKMLSLGKILSPEVVMILEGINDPSRLAELISANIGLKVEELQRILENTDPIDKLNEVHAILTREVEILNMQAKIQSKAKEEMNKVQREYFLREQLKAIQTELGEFNDKDLEIKEFHKKIKRARMPKSAKDEALKQLSRLEKMHPDSAEASVIRTYLEWMTELPWKKSTKDNLDIKKAKKILDEDHYGLEKVKERILEFLSVRKLKEDTKGPILCFVGPPGVGKTSLGKSIARSLGRKFFRMSLGGVRDEAEIRGHRRTYIGALPGRVIQGIKQAGTNNPVFMLDEVDKIGMDFRGDPASALLEVLDPEQNKEFSDHYLNVPFDLSNVMFITTANFIDPIPPALKDRMEIIEISGYTDDEKIQIAKRYLLPRQINENGLKKENIKVTDRAILKIINEYTAESGVRNLERNIGTLCRKVAKHIALNEGSHFSITAKNLNKFLGVPKYISDDDILENAIGIATGLAWTQYGGEVLYIETMLVAGSGKLILTGQLGDVMKESAQAALTYARSRAGFYDINRELFDKKDIHIHVPAGAIPKDGPSAGITIATSLISALSKIPVKKEVCMTGEITLTGRVLPIGGLKEKSLAALRAKKEVIVVPERNKKDMEDIPEKVKKGLKFVFVKHMDEVLNIALEMDSR